MPRGKLQSAPRLNPAWLSPREHPPLADREVHIWLAHLDELEAAAPSVLSMLAPDERTRAERFRFHKHRARYITARSILRRLLGRYLHRRPEQLRFDYNAYGKPFLTGREGMTGVRFNSSHAEELALYAFALNMEIGVDLEYVRDNFDCQEIAKHFFSAREAATPCALSESQRTEGFFNCWTRKEAYIKARGKGLSLPLDGFDVSLAPGERAALLGVRDERQELLRWSLSELSPAAGYIGAVAVEGSGWQLRCHRWQG